MQAVEDEPGMNLLEVARSGAEVQEGRKRAGRSCLGGGKA